MQSYRADMFGLLSSLIIVLVIAKFLCAVVLPVTNYSMAPLKRIVQML